MRISFHIDTPTLKRLTRRTHGLEFDYYERQYGDEQRNRVLVESLAHHLSAAAGEPATVTIVNIERFDLELPE